MKSHVFTAAMEIINHFLPDQPVSIALNCVKLLFRPKRLGVSEAFGKGSGCARLDTNSITLPCSLARAGNK